MNQVTCFKKLQALRLVTIFIAVFASSSLHAELFIYQLKHQQAEMIIPVIQPHLTDEQVITSKLNQLFIQSSESDYQKILPLIEQLDTAIKQYRVEVKILNRKLDTWELSGAQINVANDKVSGQVKRYQTGSSRKDNQVYSLKVMEGAQGYIHTGESFLTHSLTQHYKSFIPQGGQHKVTSGFYVQVQSSADNKVRVDVSAKAQKRRAQSIQSSGANTSVVGELNHWLLLASIDNKEQSQSNRNYSSSNSRSNKRWYYLKVIAINP